MPVSSEALSQASRITSALSAPSASTAACSAIVPRVSVPVLSVHSTSMPPRSSIASSRRTITPSPASRPAPRASDTLMIAGSSSGDSPTASATANSIDSITGRPSIALATSTATTTTSITRSSISPKRRAPRAKSLSGTGCARRPPTSPSAVARPVAVTSTVAVPLRTELPRNTQLVRLRSGASALATPAAFSTGNDSPVRLASTTRKSRAARITPSAGTRLPADSVITSPGTRAWASISRVAPSRRARTVSASRLRSCAIAVEARYSCQKPSSALPATMNRMTAASVQSATNSEISAPATRISTSGLENCRSSSRHAASSRRGSTLLGPMRASRWRASASLRPSACDDSASSSSAAGRLQ